MQHSVPKMGINTVHQKMDLKSGEPQMPTSNRLSLPLNSSPLSKSTPDINGHGIVKIAVFHIDKYLVYILLKYEVVLSF